MIGECFICGKDAEYTKDENRPFITHVQCSDENCNYPHKEAFEEAIERKDWPEVIGD